MGAVGTCHCQWGPGGGACGASHSCVAGEVAAESGGLCGAVGVQDVADTLALCTVATWWPRQSCASQWRRQLVQGLPMGKSPGNHLKISKVEKKRKKKKEKTHRLPARTQRRAYLCALLSKRGEGGRQEEGREERG